MTLELLTYNDTRSYQGNKTSCSILKERRNYFPRWKDRESHIQLAFLSLLITQKTSPALRLFQHPISTLCGTHRACLSPVVGNP